MDGIHMSPVALGKEIKFHIILNNWDSLIGKGEIWFKYIMINTYWNLKQHYGLNLYTFHIFTFDLFVIIQTLIILDLILIKCV